MAQGVIKFVEQFFWTMVWIFLMLIVGSYLLDKGKHLDGPIGSFSAWVGDHAQP